MFDIGTETTFSTSTLREANQPQCPRDSRGCFTGEGYVPLPEPAPTPAFVPLATAADLLSEEVDAAIAGLIGSGWTEEDGTPPPVAVIRASPGAGKSRQVREALCGPIGAEIGEIAFLAPTLALADEAAAHAREIGASAVAIRGRNAATPEGTGRMCRKSDLTSRASLLGLPIREHFCERRGADGEPLRCEHFDGCAYLAQLAPLEGPLKQHYLATSYLALPDPTGRKTSLRVIDETFHQQLEHISDVTLSEFTLPRLHYPQLVRAKAKTTRTAEHADLLRAAGDVAGALLSRRSPLQLEYTVEDYERLARMEMAALPAVDGLAPDQDAAVQRRVLGRAETESRLAYRFRRLWLILAEAKRQGRDETERLRLVVAGRAHRIRICSRKHLPSDAPLLLLDADADPDFLAAIGCAPQAMTTLALRPHAHVLQLHDRRMSKGTLLEQPRLREEWRAIIGKEVLRDRAGPRGGVLVGATREVVKSFFADAGHKFEDLPESQISQIMLETPLFGACWTWFGGRSLGSNRYRDFSAVIIIGREELPVEALEDKARALFGDRPGASLSFVAPDARGQTFLPEEIVPYLMTNGSACGARVRCHPDPLIRALQRQGRECATRQLIERLRLARASYRKRVIIGCNIPIPDLPVERLVSWEELCPGRLASAAIEALRVKGGLRLSARGLVEDAPATFSTCDAAEAYRSRNAGELAAAHAQPERLDLGPLWPLWLKQRRRHAREEPALVPARSAAEALARAAAIWGPLVSCRSVRPPMRDAAEADQLP